MALTAMAQASAQIYPDIEHGSIARVLFSQTNIQQWALWIAAPHTIVSLLCRGGE
jgi:hypothetical protein